MTEATPPTPGEIAVLAGGGVTLIGSFLDFSGDTSAWGKGLFPIVTLIPIYAAIVAAHVAIERWSNVRLRASAPFGLTWRHMRVALSDFAFLMAFFWQITINDAGIGLYLMLIGTAACAVGVLMLMRDVPLASPNSYARTGSLSPAGITLLAGAAVVFVGSFLDFWEISLDSGVATFSRGFNAWSGDLLFPVSILPVLCALVIGIHLALATFAKTQLPPDVSGFSWDQIYLLVAFQGLVMMVAFLIQEKFLFEVAIGFWLMLLGSIALAVGSVLHHRDVAAPAP